MKTTSVACVLLLTVSGAVEAQQSTDWRAVDAAIGRPGVDQPGGVHRFNFPRSDLQVTVNGLLLKPALALGGWVAFKMVPGGAVAMGDLVLTDEEVAPVVTKLQAGGVEQTAIHHHILHESPRITYVHVHGEGDPTKIAEAVRAAVALTRTPAPAPPAASNESAGIDTAQVSKALGYGGRMNGGVYQVSVPRNETVRDAGNEIPPSMGLATAMNFQPTGGGKAVITGDFVLIRSEVNPVIRALTQSGIEITSLHSHLLMEEPRLMFMHFWANDDAAALARGLRLALEKTNSIRGSP